MLHFAAMLVIGLSAALFNPPALLSPNPVSFPVFFVQPSDDQIPAVVEQITEVHNNVPDKNILARSDLQPDMHEVTSQNRQNPVKLLQQSIKQQAASDIVQESDIVDTADSNDRPITPVASPQFQGLPLLVSPDFRAPPLPPVYPSKSVVNNEQGTVVLRALVDEVGNAKDILIWESSGYTLLDKAAKQAVGQWQFVPARQGFVTIAAWVEVPINFVLN